MDQITFFLNPPVPVLATVEFLIATVVSIGISVLASALLARSIKLKNPALDDKPQTLSLRGDYLNLIIGRRRVGPFFAWTGDRKITTERTGGGKASGLFGGSTQKNRVVNAAGWHVLGIGPGHALHKIWDNGRTIFTGPITPATHPSGTRVDLGKKVGIFDIYWGEPDQPINTHLGHFNRLGIHSRWPYLFYILWIKKYLGISPTWGLVEYEAEVRPFNTGLSSPAWLDNMAGVTGANAGHIIDQLLFQKYPHGAGLPRDRFDIPSLEALSNGVNSGDDFLPSHLYASDGPTMEETITSIMQDVGFFIPQDVVSGKLKFQLLRKPTGAIKNISEELLVPPKPETEINHGPKLNNRIVVSFADRERAYKDSTINLDDDGQAIRSDQSRGKRTRASLFTDFATASKVAYRREQEDPFEPSGLKIHTNRATRKISPGEPITCFGIPGPLRVITVESDPKTSEVILECLADVYGVANNTAVALPGSGLPQSTVPTADLDFDFFELPSYWTDKPEIIVLRTRADESVSEAGIWISGDGVTYQLLDTTSETVCTGTLTEAISSTGPQIIENGPIVNLLGSDLANIEDLSADSISWRLGRQIMLLGTSEVCFLKGAQILNAGQFKPQGIIRARYGGIKQSHSVGAKVHIFNRDFPTRYQHVLIAPNKTLFMKVAPIIGATEVTLEDIVAIEKDITGKYARALTPINLNTSNNRKCFTPGSAITFKWRYYSTQNPDTGAGEQNAGQAYIASPVQGAFELKLLTTGNVLKHTASNLTSPTYTISNAALVTAFSGEPSSFKLQITHTKNGLISAIAEATIVRT